MNLSIMRRLVASFTAIAALSVAIACGSSSTTRTNALDQAPPASGTAAQADTTADFDRFVDLLTAAPINEVYDRTYPGNVDALAKQSDFVIQGSIVSVAPAADVPFSVLPDGSRQPLDPDLVFGGIMVTLHTDSVGGRGYSDLVSAGDTIDVRVVLWSGPREERATMDNMIRSVVEAAPAGSSLMLFGRNAGIRDGVPTADPFPLLFAETSESATRAPHPEIARWADGLPFSEFKATALESVPQ
jgi:hypothetical protein